MLAVIQQQVAQTGAGKVGIELLVIGRWQAKRQLIAGQGIGTGISRTCTGARIGSRRIGGVSHQAIYQRQFGKAIAVDARQVGKKIAIDCPGKIDKTQFTILVLRLIDDRDIIAATNIHRIRVAIVLIGDVEGAAIRTHVGNKGNVSGSAKGPDPISARKDGDRANTRSRPRRQACLLGINHPIGCITPVKR